MDPKFAYFYNALNCKVIKLCQKIEYQEKVILMLKNKIEEIICILNKDEQKFDLFKNDIEEMETLLNQTFGNDLMILEDNDSLINDCK